jgi:flagellar basal-body rod protein FlgB
MPISFDSAFGIHEQALLLSEKRTEILAENLANVDTPNYKARDIDFKSLMQQVAATNDGGIQLNTTNSAHIQGGADPASPQLLYRVPTQPSADGNTVENQIEQAQFAENAVRYQASFTFLSDSIKGLVSAIRGQ